jgi:type II secretory pathway pseudopilin PulG
MNRGFSLIEVILALFLLEVGILATVGMFLLSQRNFRRAELTLRGILEAGWVADSLGSSGSVDPGHLVRPWGEIHWAPESTPVGGLRVSVWSPVEEDTLARVFAVSPTGFPHRSWPDSLAGDVSR